jgi:hypothetical protein
MLCRNIGNYCEWTKSTNTQIHSVPTSINGVLSDLIAVSHLLFVIE